MSSFNKVIILGRLARDPELRTTPTGLNICKFSVATSRSFKSADGESREETTFVDVDAFGRQAEVISKFFNKGKPIFLEGRLKLDQWETNAGEKRSKLNVVLENFQFIGSKNDDSSMNDNNHYDQTAPKQRAAAPASVSAPAFDVDEDVPF